MDLALRLPAGDQRLPGNKRLVRDLYRDEHARNFKTLVLESGETVYLIKGVKEPTTVVNTSGSRGVTDKFGSRRASIPVVTGPDTSGWARPTEGTPQNQIAIPALVESSRDSKIVTPRGKEFDGDYIIHLSRLWLKEHNVEVDEHRDTFVYIGFQYHVAQLGRYGIFDDGQSEAIYGLRKVSND